MKQIKPMDWLIIQLRQLAHNPKTHLGMGDIRLTQGYLDDIEKQANKIEKNYIKEQLISFQIYLNNKGYINDYDWDFEKEAKKYLK